MKKYPSLSQHMQILETFRNYVRPIDKDFAHTLGNYTERFLNGKSVNGFVPYQVEYCVDPVSPIAAFYDEDEEESGSKPEVPCPDINTCLSEGNCTYPHCRHPERYAPKTDPASLYAVPHINYEHVTLAESGSFPATCLPVGTASQAQLIRNEEPKVLDLNIGASNDYPLLVSSSLQEETGLPAEGTGSKPANSPSENPKNMTIPLPEVNKNSSYPSPKLYPKKQPHFRKGKR